MRESFATNFVNLKSNRVNLVEIISAIFHSVISSSLYSPQIQCNKNILRHKKNKKPLSTVPLTKIVASGHGRKTEKLKTFLWNIFVFFCYFLIVLASSANVCAQWCILIFLELFKHFHSSSTDKIFVVLLSKKKKIFQITSLKKTQQR